MVPVTLYSSGFSPNVARAREVLAFVFTPAEALVPRAEPGELEAVRAVIEAAKAQLVQRWVELRRGPAN